MSTKRTALRRPRHGITAEAIEAYRARDHLRLHRALGLKPWECSPLPADVEPLGVDHSSARITCSIIMVGKKRKSYSAEKS
jgi:hypothetical protein